MGRPRLARLVRAPVLLAAGAYLLHELRFELFPAHLDHSVHHAHGSHEAGHAYLSPLGHWLLVALLLVGCGIGVAVVRALRTGSAEPPPRPFRSLWVRSTIALQAIYVGQELLEGWLSAGRVSGLEGVLGSGGWSALAIAVAVGALVALLLRQAARLIRAAARRRVAPTEAATPIFATRERRSERRREPISDFLVGRGPPAGPVFS